MALTRTKKEEVVNELVELLSSAKMTVVAEYQGTTVKSMQQLRRDAAEKGTSVKVVKNRLVVKALGQSDAHKDADTAELKGMLLYAFNAQDEVAPAQVLHAMAKNEPQIQFVGAYDDAGNFLSAEDVKALAQLPSREEMIATVMNTLKSPVNNVTNGLAGNVHGLLDAIAAKAA